GAILGCLVLGAVSTLAQTGSISGKITDSAGYVVAGAEINAVILSPDRAVTSQAFRAISNNNGEFTIPSLPSGSYEVEVKATGLKTLKEKVIVAASQPTRIDLQITPQKVCEDAKGPNIELVEKDKAEIINQVLKMMIKSWQVVGEPILLSTQNIKADWVSALPGHTVTALPILEIFMRARPGKPVSYWYFSEFEVHGNCVAIELNQSDARSEGEGCNLCGRGATYVFRKEAAEWKGKCFSAWIS